MSINVVDTAFATSEGQIHKPEVAGGVPLYILCVLSVSQILLWCVLSGHWAEHLVVSMTV